MSFEVGESWVYTATYTVTQPEIDSNGGGDGVINNTATVDCDQLEPKYIQLKIPYNTPIYPIDKIVTDVAGKGPAGNITKAGENFLRG